MIADIVLGAQYGDEGKGKVTHHLLKSGKYTHCIRFNGSNNAGHTIYHEGQKIVTHSIPSGVLYDDIRCIIGPGCALNPEQFFLELKELEDAGINTNNVFIADNCHVIMPDHLSEDGTDEVIGTTRRGNGPAYRAKYGRTGVLAREIPEFKPYLVNFYEELHGNGQKPVILCEGAQGFGLDIDWGDYPYVTSSHCTTGSVILNGIPHQWVRNVWGVAKIYETYVGKKLFQDPNEPVFERICQVGTEFGATTGRKRQIGWLDTDLLDKSAKINGFTHLIFNKCDVLKQIGVFKARKGAEKTLEFTQFTHFEAYLRAKYGHFEGKKRQIFFSETPNGI